MIEFTPGQRRLMAGSGGAGEGPIITQIERVIVDPKVEADVDLGAR